MSEYDMHAITITWDLDAGTGLSVRYGDMDADRAAKLLSLASRLVREHSCLLAELDEYDDHEVLVDDLFDDDYDDEEEQEHDE